MQSFINCFTPVREDAVREEYILNPFPNEITDYIVQKMETKDKLAFATCSSKLNETITKLCPINPSALFDAITGVCNRVLEGEIRPSGSFSSWSRPNDDLISADFNFQLMRTGGKNCFNPIINDTDYFNNVPSFLQKIEMLTPIVFGDEVKINEIKSRINKEKQIIEVFVECSKKGIESIKLSGEITEEQIQDVQELLARRMNQSRS